MIFWKDLNAHVLLTGIYLTLFGLLLFHHRNRRNTCNDMFLPVGGGAVKLRYTLQSFSCCLTMEGWTSQSYCDICLLIYCFQEHPMKSFSPVCHHLASSQIPGHHHTRPCFILLQLSISVLTLTGEERNESMCTVWLMRMSLCTF